MQLRGLSHAARPRGAVGAARGLSTALMPATMPRGLSNAAKGPVGAAKAGALCRTLLGALMPATKGRGLSGLLRGLSGLLRPLCRLLSTALSRATKHGPCRT